MEKWENRDRKISKRRTLKEMNSGYREPDRDDKTSSKQLRKEMDRLLKALENQDDKRTFTKDTS
jgi:hypothetical protein